jgi:hypothetical protein
MSKKLQNVATCTYSDRGRNHLFKVVSERKIANPAKAQSQTTRTHYNTLDIVSLKNEAQLKKNRY